MSTVPLAIDTNKLRFLNTQNRVVPCEGPRAVPVLLDFTAATGGPTYSIDLQNMEALKRISNVQAMYIDNSQGAAPLVITIPSTGQVISIAPGHQAYKNVLCPNPAALVFSSQNQIIQTVHLLNFPVIDSDWSAS